MKSSLILQDSIVRDCWKLLVDKGLLNRERVRSKIIYGWERCRLLAVDPYKTISQLPLATLPRTVLAPDYDWLENCTQHKVAVLISDQHGQVRFSNLKTRIFNTIKTQTLLKEQATGNLSVYLTQQSNEQELVFGAEHFLSELHHIVDITMPIYIENTLHYLTFFTTIGSYHEDLINQLQLLKAQLADILKTADVVSSNDAQNINRITIDTHGNIIAKIGDNPVLNIGDNLFMQLEDTQVANMQAGLPTLLQFATDKAYIATLCHQTGQASDYLIRPSTDIGHLVQQQTFNQLQKKNTSLDKAILQRLERFAKHPLAVLFVGNDQQKINAKIDYLYHAMPNCRQFMVYDCRLSYRLFAEDTNMSTLGQLVCQSQSQMIVIAHLEALNTNQQALLLQQINALQSQLKEKQLKLVLTMALAPQSDNGDAKHWIKQFEMRTDYSYQVRETSAGTAPAVVGEHDITDTSVNLEIIEKKAIQKALYLTKGNRQQAAKLLGVGRTTLYRKLKQYNLCNVSN